MSNAIRYDGLLLRELAVELDARLRGMRLARAQFERDSRVLVLTAGPRRAPLTVSWKLHPESGHLWLRAAVAPRIGARLQLPPDASIARVGAIPDERILRFELAAGPAAAGLVRAIVVELIGTRWNALALAADDVVVDMLVSRPTDVRALRPGARYCRPAARPRLGASEPPELAQWLAILAPAAPGERRSLLLDSFAYASPVNASWILGDAALPEAGTHLLAEAHRRYLGLTRSPPRPALLAGVQPYPQPLSERDLPAGSLLAAFALAGELSPPAAGEGAAEVRDQLLVALHEREQRLRTRREKLEREARGAAADALRLRADADLLLAHLQDVPRGASAVELTDFTGRQRRLQLEPAWSAQRNAQHWYEQARRREHAAERVPALLRRVASEEQRLAAVREQVAAGAAGPDELRELARRTEAGPRRTPLPYRSYRTSGGLEVRVGRNARANDELTRAHSSPEDIWLHARAAGGAHVVLRWGRRDGNPPRADLLEAAGLAALHSRARTSAVVPVDWTRRKYVRKRRKAAPGQVVMERASTVFVAPDPQLETRLGQDESAL